MQIVISLNIAMLALVHLYILYFEMFSWSKTGYKVFKKYPKEFFNQTKILAANQGLYKGFLAAGLIWTFFIADPFWQINVAVFFLICVLIAGTYGAATADKKILFVQAFPAGIALILIFWP